MPSASNKKAVFIENKQPFQNDIEDFIYRWNVTYPMDRWWREKHKVAFNSPEHRVVSFLDMYIEWREEQLYNKVRENNIRHTEYKPGDWLQDRKKVISIAEEIEAFENTDLSQFDDPEVKNGR
jgi:hypothetical protein